MRYSLFLLALPLVGCFPELPDAQVVTNLRVLSIRTDPAVVAIAFPPPKLKIEALVAHPTDLSGRTLSHEWSLELGDEEFEGREQFDALLPSGPQSNAITIDFAALFAERDGGWAAAVLPLNYRVRSSDDERKAVKLVRFLLPELPAGDDDDSAVPTEPVEFLLPEETEDWNSNPVIDSLTMGDVTYSLADGTLPGPDSPLYIGDVDAEEGLQVAFVATDAEQDINPKLFWTAGTAGLPVDDAPGGGPFGGATDDDDATAEDDDDDGGGFGFGGAEPFLDDTTFAWTPPEAVDEFTRLWFVVEDGAGGATWQEIRLGTKPSRAQ